MKLHSFLILATCLTGVPQVQAEPVSVNIEVRTELDKPVLPAGSTERAVVKIRLLPASVLPQQQRAPLNLAIALDRSGSMSGSRIEQAREGGLVALGMLGREDRFALVAYGDKAETWIPSQHPLQSTRLANRIRQISAGGMTALFAGVAQAAEEMRRGATSGSIDRLILLSDGQANVGPSSPSDLSALGYELASEGIIVSTIGLGLGYNEDLMTALAETGQGNAYFAEGPEDLQRIFATELEDLLNVAATDIRITVHCAPGVRPLGSIGRQGTVRGNEVTFEISQLFGGQERFALLELEVPEGREGDVRDLVSVTVDYRDALNGTEAQREAQAQISYSGNMEKVQASANVEVARTVVDNRLAEVKREVIALSDAGHNAEAAERLRKLNRNVSELNSLYRDEALEQQAQAIDNEAALLERSQLSNAQRKSYMEGSYRTLNQQRQSD